MMCGDMENYFVLYQCTGRSIVSAATKQENWEWGNGTISQQQGIFSIDYYRPRT